MPAAIAKAVVAVERDRGTKRPPEQASSNPNPKARRGGRGEPARVFHAGCPMFEADLAGKTPGQIFYKFCHKVRGRGKGRDRGRG